MKIQDEQRERKSHWWLKSNITGKLQKLTKIIVVNNTNTNKRAVGKFIYKDNSSRIKIMFT